MSPLRLDLTTRLARSLGVLDHVEVLSTVSGGSLIGAMWAYSDDDFATFDRKVTELLLLLLPAQLDEGKAHLTIGFGCTGGQHRSVAVAEEMGKALAEAGWPVSKRHRELERRAAALPAAKAGAGGP